MSTVSTTIQLDSALKEESQELFESFGLSLSAAITIFLRQSVQEQGIPFRVGRPVFNEETRRAIEDARNGIGLTEEYLKAIEDARNGIGLTEGYHSAAELFAALDAEKDERTGKKSLRGVLSAYANPDLMEREEGAWERAVVEK